MDAKKINNPFGVQVLFALPWVIRFLALSLLIIPGLRWTEAQIPTWVKIQIGLLVGASTALFWMANFWNLILK